METIKQLIDQYGPAVVAAAQRQVGVRVGQDVAWLVVGLVFAGLLIIGTPKLWRKIDDADSCDQSIFRFFLTAGAVLLGVVVFFVFITGPIGEIWTYTLNPDYAVIQIVRQMVLAK